MMIRAQVSLYPDGPFYDIRPTCPGAEVVLTCQSSRPVTQRLPPRKAVVARGRKVSRCCAILVMIPFARFSQQMCGSEQPFSISRKIPYTIADGNWIDK